MLDEFKDAFDTEHFNFLKWLRYAYNGLKSSVVSGMLYNRGSGKKNALGISFKNS